ncbi:hypothetical protein OCU04_003903 [Sclerotinia nivalis]|uniref:Glucose-methanol-choline oxidoreductase N-terminal domain-containing protein n=1 Tax=Sclerotinia nivalis TaxID=352851 RepID=A0A9X0DLT1_9HELO|nr:hypothetical protein OCU04_003903 [Sclerotinia nivalis]
MILPEYDFIIVGGGTSGLVLASRLSENPGVQVLVIEAGENHDNDPRVKVLALWASLRGTEEDWDFESQPQVSWWKANKSCTRQNSRGSSAINAQVFVPPSETVIDAWEKLGNPKWNWETLMPYFCKAFKAPKKLSTSERSDINGCSSDEGNIQTSYAGSMSASEPISQAWLETFKRLNYATDDVPFSGVGQGAFSSLSSIDPATATRSYSANAYYTPVSGRQNLHLLTNAYVAKVLLESTGTSSELCATGVQYIKDAEVNFVRARKEVILAAGTLQSPKLLELSGIGREELLRDHGIEVFVNNPNIGENLQDHIFASRAFEEQSIISNLDDLRHQDPELIERAMEEYITTKSGPFVSPGFGPNAYLPIVEFLSEDDASSKYFAIVKDILQDAKDASASFPTVIVRTNIDDELPGNFLSILAILSMPLSRGYVHIQSADALTDPIIDPRFLSHPLDLEVLARHVNFIDTIVDSEPLRSTVLKAGGQRSEPTAGFSTLDDAKDFIRNTAVSMWHPTSTCSMLPRELGGVVSPDLVVYGTSNLRIADASIMPLIPRANTQSTVYAVAERAADIIKIGHSL